MNDKNLSEQIERLKTAIRKTLSDMRNPKSRRCNLGDCLAMQRKRLANLERMRAAGRRYYQPHVLNKEADALLAPQFFKVEVLRDGKWVQSD